MFQLAQVPVEQVAPSVLFALRPPVPGYLATLVDSATRRVRIFVKAAPTIVRMENFATAADLLRRVFCLEYFRPLAHSA